MKGDHMGILAADPTQRELPLSNWARFRVKLSCCGAFGEGYIEAEFVEPSGEASGQAGALGALEVVGAEVVVIHPALEHEVHCREDRPRHRHNGLLWTRR